MTWYGVTPNSSGFQAAMSMATHSADDGYVFPHHPITCTSELRFELDGTFSCAHKSVPPDDPRTQFCLDFSVANLIIEFALKL